MLIEAKNPLISVGDEITWCRGEKELLELAELLGAPVAGITGGLGYWSKPFPTRHPLYIGTVLRTMRFPGKPDVLLNLGNRFGELGSPGTKLISIRLDPTSLARGAPVDVPIVADLRLAIADLNAAIRSLAPAARLSVIADQRASRGRAYSAQMADARQAIANGLSNSSPISLERLGTELEANLDRDTCYVADVDSGKTMDPLMSIRRRRQAIFRYQSQRAGLGHGGGIRCQTGATRRAGGLRGRRWQLLFSGPQPLWSMARYKAPVTTIVLNNHSYNNERNRIWNSAGRQFETARDMTCYNGNPDVDFTKAANAFGVEGETVKEPGDIEDGASARQNGDGRGPALSARYPYQARRHRRGVGMASGLFRRRPAQPESMIMRIVLSGLLAFVIVAAASPGFAQNANPLPPGDGRDIVAVACSQCHYLGTIAKIRNGAAGWRMYVNNMVLRGAQLTPAEIDKVVDYLVAQSRSGRQLAAGQAGDAAGRAAARIWSKPAAAYATTLNASPPPSARRRAWPVIVNNMVAWGATATPDEAKTMTDYLAANFGN